jgi:pyrophosphatase PpaX
VGEDLRAVLFDLDGTLIDTTDLIFRSYHHALGAVLGEPPTDEELFLGFGQPLPEAFAAILDHRRIDPPSLERLALIERLILTYRAFNLAHHDELAREVPGAKATLEALRERGYRVGLVTSKARAIAERGLRLVGLANAFEVAVCAEDSIRHKPHPDPLLVALDRLGLRATPRAALYVGDSTHDLVAGRAAGVRTAAALWGPFPEASLRALAPDLFLDRVEALLDDLPALGDEEG